MSEAAEQLITRHLALEKVHERQGAIMHEEDGWRVPAAYSEVLAEYDAVRDGSAGLIDLSARARILVSGSEAIQFLNGLITNDMKTLAEHSWMPAAFPNVQGRLIASVRVARIKDDLTGKNPSPTFLLDTEPATHEAVLKTIQRFTMAGDFRVSDVTSSKALLSVQGGKAGEIVGSVLGEAAAEIPQNGAYQIEWQQSELTVVRATHTGENGFDLVVDAERASMLWDSLIQAGAQPVGYEAFEILRIEAGVPRYGRDMNETNVVTEANLDDAVSFTKGCYIGQEIIARIKYRGHVAKKLTGLLFEKEEQVIHGATILSPENKDIGRITSVTNSPQLKRTIALGYVRYEHLAPDTRVRIKSGENEYPAIVSELPFLRGSWYHD